MQPHRMRKEEQNVRAGVILSLCRCGIFTEQAHVLPNAASTACTAEHARKNSHRRSGSSSTLLTSPVLTEILQELQLQGALSRRACCSSCPGLPRQQHQAAAHHLAAAALRGSSGVMDRQADSQQAPKAQQVPACCVTQQLAALRVSTQSAPCQHEQRVCLFCFNALSRVRCG